MMRKWTRTAAVAAAVGLGGMGDAALLRAQPPLPEPTLPGIPVLPAAGAPVKPVAPLTMQDLPAVGSPKPVEAARPVESPKPLTIEPITEPTLPTMKPVNAPRPNKPVEAATMKAETPMVASPMAGMRDSAAMGVVAKAEPAISLEWAGSSSVKLGQPSDYALHVRNTSGGAVQKVVVQVRLPREVTVAGFEPKAESIEGVLLWELGTLMPKQEKLLKMKVMASAKAEMNCQAWVTFTGSAAMKLTVREPKLAVKASAPDRILMGDPANITLTLSNPGDFTTESIKMTTTLGEGLEGLRGNKTTQEIGSLAPGETRTIQVPCVSKAGGSQKCEVYVEAEGGLRATDAVAVNVVTPQLNLEVLGPKMRYLDRKATYTFKVTNPGDAPANNVFITDVVPAGFKFVGADAGGQHDLATASVKWFVGEIAPGQSKEVKVELVAVNAGEFTHKVLASASRGVKTGKELATKVEGLSAIQMEVTETENPVEVGKDTTFEIRVANAGSKAEEAVKLVCTIPPQMKLKSASGPVKYDVVGNEVVFESLGKLTPKADVIFKVTCTATAKGDARFKAQLGAAGLTEPLIKQESTKIYED